MEKMTTFVTLASLVMVCEFSWRKAGNSGVLRAKLHEAPHADGVLCYPSAGQGHWFCTNTALQCCILAHLIACCSQNMLFLIKRKEKKRSSFSLFPELRYCLFQQSHFYIIGNAEMLFLLHLIEHILTLY